MYLHWGAVLPFLINAAARHRKLHDAVRDMCMKSRSMLCQCVFHLTATFEHRHESLLTQQQQQEDEERRRAENYPGNTHSISSAQTGPTASSLFVTEETHNEEGKSVVGASRQDIASESTFTLLQQQQQQQQEQQQEQKQQNWKSMAANSLSSPGGTDRREIDVAIQRPNDTQHQWRSSMLRILAEVGAEQKAMIQQTIQLCEFVRNGKNTSISLGTCALPAPTWFLQRRIVEVDGEEENSMKYSASKTKNFSPGNENEILSEKERSAKARPSEVQRILHVRRQLVPHQAPQRRREEVLLFFLSDGSCLRFHNIDVVEDITVGSTTPSSLGYGLGNIGGGGGGGQMSVDMATLTTTSAAGVGGCVGGGGSDVTSFGLASITLPAVGGEKGISHTESTDHTAFIRPLATMESAVCCLLGHLPVQFVRRPLVLPIGIQEFITQLPDRAIYTSGWLIKLPPSLQFNCAASMMRQPSSIFHILSEYSLRYRDENSFYNQQNHRKSQQQQQQEDASTDVNDGNSTHAASSSTGPQRHKYTDTTDAAHSSRSERNRRRLLAKYESLLELAFNDGHVRPLCTFIRQIMLTKKLSEAEYPRPAAKLVSLLAIAEELLQGRSRTREESQKTSDAPGKRTTTNLSSTDVDNEEFQMSEGYSSISMSPCKKSKNIHPITAEALTKLRISILELESPRYTPALRLAFQSSSADAAQWLEITHVYTHELAEWSILQYLLDTTQRECATFFVDFSTGHVASHHLGVHALQPLSPHSMRNRHSGSSAVVDGVLSEEIRKDEMIIEENNPSSASSHFCRDPSIFRLTGCLASPLPLMCPYGVFLGRATRCLYSFLRYRRELTGIISFGFHDLRYFTWSPTIQQQPSLPTDGVDVDVTIKSNSGVNIPDASNREVSRLTASGVTLQPADLCVNAGAMTTPLGELPATPIMEGAPHTMELAVAGFDKSISSSPLKATQNAITVPYSTNTHDTTEQGTRTEGQSEEERRRATAATEAFRRMSYSAVNAAVFDTWRTRNIQYQQQQQQQRRNLLPRLFDGSSMIEKLTDEFLPMQDEPKLVYFTYPPTEDSKDLIFLYPHNSMADPEVSINVPEKPFLPPTVSSSSKLMGRATSNLGNRGTARTVNERVSQLIRAAMEPENLVGTVNTPHGWSLWAPHW